MNRVNFGAAVADNSEITLGDVIGVDARVDVNLLEIPTLPRIGICTFGTVDGGAPREGDEERIAQQ